MKVIGTCVYIPFIYILYFRVVLYMVRHALHQTPVRLVMNDRLFTGEEKGEVRPVVVVQGLIASRNGIMLALK